MPSTYTKPPEYGRGPRRTRYTPGASKHNVLAACGATIPCGVLHRRVALPDVGMPRGRSGSRRVVARSISVARWPLRLSGRGGAGCRIPYRGAVTGHGSVPDGFGCDAGGSEHRAAASTDSCDPANVTLSTARLQIRRFRVEDAAALAGYRSDPEVARYQSWMTPLSEDEAAALAQTFRDGDPTMPGWFQYAIFARAEGLLIGDIGVDRHDNGMQAEIGFTLGRPWWRRGYASEAVHRVLEHLFLDDGLHRVSAECDARNASSERVLDRLGFRREGLRRSHTWIKGEWTDDLVFGLLAEEWSGHRLDEPASDRTT